MGRRTGLRIARDGKGRDEGCNPKDRPRSGAGTLARIENGGRLRLERLSVSGEGAPAVPLITTSERSMTANYAVELQDCAIADVRGDVIGPRKGSLADVIAIRDSRSSIACVLRSRWRK